MLNDYGPVGPQNLEADQTARPALYPV